MLRKTVFAAVMVALPMSSAMAKDSTGCGVGTMIFDGKSGPIFQSLAVTTNGTSANQTFGITSGTLGCDTEGVIQASARTTQFVSSNMEKLARDMAAGEGEALSSLAQVIGVQEQDKQAFFRVAQDHFSEIYSGADVTAGEVVKRLGDAMANNAILKDYTSVEA
jgi:uncharacterized protein YukE